MARKICYGKKVAYLNFCFLLQKFILARVKTLKFRILAPKLPFYIGNLEVKNTRFERCVVGVKGPGWIQQMPRLEQCPGFSTNEEAI
jgi:hypothetical protein